MGELPTGTVTFLFTDIEGSTRLWEVHPEAMRSALARHDALLRQAIDASNGVVFNTFGDAFCAAFATAPEALSAAVEAQIALNSEPWPEGLSLRVRMALHTGTAELRDGDYLGQPLNRIARLLSAGHGGQVLVSAATQELARDTLPPSVRFKPLGEHRLRDLGRPETVFQLCPPDLPSEFPALRSLENPQLPNNLPQQVTSFIGREKEIAEIRSLMERTRLLTLTGTGGCGKTRLSLQVAADLLENYPGGVWLVELAPLADPALVPQTLARVLGVTEEAGKPLTQTLAAALKPRRLLIVLDNCEHLVVACSQLCDTLIRTCPGVRVLASSREGLSIAGETVYRVPSLSLPDASRPLSLQSLSQYEAVRLFVERAQAALSTFSVTNANAPALAQLCVHLDGIPLALELAAARVRSLSVEEINNKLDNRFRLLTGGSRTALPRQQTLRAAIDWSYDLLNAQETRLLRRLSVFAGGWTLAAAEPVGAGESGAGPGIEAWEVLDLLTSLVEKSLVNAQVQGETTRYGLLETVRQYAHDRLMESREHNAVCARHADFFLTLAEEARPQWHGSEQVYWLGVFTEESDNLRQALAFYTEEAKKGESGEKGMRLASALQIFWQIHGHLSEGREHLRVLLAQPGGQEPTPARAGALHTAGTLASIHGDYAQARKLLEESLAMRRVLGHKPGISVSLGNLGGVVWRQGDLARARVLYQESLVLAREAGDRHFTAFALLNLGNVACDQGDYPGASALYEESLALWRELGNKMRIAEALGDLGSMRHAQGDLARARDHFKESLSLSRELGFKQGIAQSLEAFACLALKEARTERCVRLWGAAAALREIISSPLAPDVREKQEREIATVRKTLGESAFAKAWTEGRAMTLEQAIAYALEPDASPGDGE